MSSAKGRSFDHCEAAIVSRWSVVGTLRGRYVSWAKDDAQRMTSNSVVLSVSPA
jgi:hypothetical protein